MEEARAAVEADLQLLVDEYGDVPKGGSTYGEIAHAHLTAYTDEELAKTFGPAKKANPYLPTCF